MSILLNVAMDIESLPRNMVFDPPLSDLEFEEFCRNADNVRIERTREGVIQVNPPASGETSSGNSEINRQLGNWWITHRKGVVFDSSGGFRLSDGSTLSPDAAYVGPDRLKGVSLQGFPRVCPDFVIELRSKSDSLPSAKAQMIRWIENGVALGWRVDPYERKVYVFNPHPVAKQAQMSEVTGKFVHGTHPVEGFHLDLEEVWSRYDI